MSGGAPATLQTLERGLLALRAVAEAEDGLKMQEIADRLGVHRTIAYRIANTLVAHAMLHRRADGRLVLGSGALVLGARAEGTLRALARPFVERLARETGAAAYLSVAEGEDGVAILSVDPPSAFLDVRYRRGTRHPLTRGAAGIAILSGRPPADGDGEAVQRARRDGYSATAGELQAGAVGVASPVRLPRRDFPGLECSLGVVALTGLDLEAVGAAVSRAAADFAASLTPSDTAD